MIGVSEEKYVSEYQEKYKKKGSPNSRGSKSSNTSLRDGTAFSDILSDTDPVVNTFEPKTFEKAKRSRNISDEKVTLTNGKLAALRANYHGDKMVKYHDRKTASAVGIDKSHTPIMADAASVVSILHLFVFVKDLFSVG